MRERVMLPLQLHVGREPVEGGTGESKGGGGFKPIGALWTSTFETAWSEGWPWWLENEGYDYSWGNEYESTGWLLKPRECDVWQIDNVRDAAALLDEFGELRYPHSQSFPDVIQPDWEAIQESGIAAVRLTCPYDPEVRFGLGIVFYGWDCESTAWLTWQFESVRSFVLPELEDRSEEDYDDPEIWEEIADATDH